MWFSIVSRIALALASLRSSTGSDGGGGSGGSGGTADGTTPAANNIYGGSGGSGIIIFKVPDSINVSFSSGVTVTGGTPSGGFKIYTVTAAGSGDYVVFS
jgi:hypothetical protein